MQALHPERSLSFRVLVTFGPASLSVRSILLGPSAFAGHLPVAIATALAATPFPKVAFSREPYGAQNRAALSADFTGEHPMLRQEVVTLLTGEHHVSSLPCAAEMPRHI